MKIKLVNGTIYDVKRADVTYGRLEIDFEVKSAEELQEIFNVPGNLVLIELLTDDEEKFGELTGWTVYGGVMLNGKIKTVILTKETDTTAERLARAEAGAIAANVAAMTAREISEEVEDQIANIQKETTEHNTLMEECLIEMSEVVYA